MSVQLPAASTFQRAVMSLPTLTTVDESGEVGSGAAATREMAASAARRAVAWKASMAREGEKAGRGGVRGEKG